MARGVPSRQPRRSWTSEELELLPELAEGLSVLDIARKLDRSENSVKTKLLRLHVSRRNRSGWFTEQEVCEILGVDHKWLKRRPIKMVPFDCNHHPRKGKSTPWKITETDLKDFICTYPEEIASKDFDFVMVVDILAGIKVPYH